MIEQAVLEYVVNSVWQVPMLAAMAWLFVWLSRPGPRTQHWLWLATLAVAIILPLRGIGALDAIPMRASFARMDAAQLALLAHAPQTTNDTPEFGRLASDAVAPLRDTQQHWRLLRTMTWLPTRPLRLGRQTAYWLLGVYLAALIFRLIQLARAWRAASNLVANATEAVLSQPTQAMLVSFCERFHVRRPRVLISGEVVSPITVGVERPVLLLPKTFHKNTESEIAAVLCHELAHVRRRDYLVNLACQAAALPIAYHPATYAVQRRIRQTREMVCDAMAGDAMRSASGYARCLLALAQRMLDGRDMAERVQAVGLFDNNTLEERVMGLLEKKTTLSAPVRVIRMAGGVVLMASVTAAAMIFHVTPTVVNAAQAVLPTEQTAAGNTGNADGSGRQQTAPTPAPQSPTPPHPPSIQGVPAPATAPVGSGHAVPKPEKPIPRIVNRERRDLTPEQRARLEKELSAADATIRDETQRLQSPAFKKQMADMQRQIQDATKKLQSDEVQRQMQIMQSPEFKKQMADMQRQIQDATTKLRSDEVQQQMQIMQSPAFKKQMQDMQQRIQDATKKLQSDQVQRQVRIIQSPEFKKQMQDMQRQIQDATKKLQTEPHP